MKKISFLLLIIVAAVGCSEEERLFIKTDEVAPGVVKDVTVRNIPGGAVLRYTLPDDEDLLYVKASYELTPGTVSEVKSSLFVDTLKVEGFGSEGDRRVALTAVDRSGNESTPVYATISPMEPPVLSIGRSIMLLPDFGGIRVYWDNPDRKDINIVIEQKDDNDEYNRLDVFYSTQERGNSVTRGLDTLAYQVKVYAEDHWGNKSVAIEDVIVPMYEEELDKSRFRAYYLEGDAQSAYGWQMPGMWDGEVVNWYGFHTGAESGWPQTFTMDLGVLAQLSRVVVFQRPDYWYNHGNPRKYEVYGASDESRLNDPDAWTLLADCESIKPSGSPDGIYTSEDVEYASKGEEYSIEPSAPKVRFIRFRITKSWGGGTFFHISELSFYGQVSAN